MLFTLAIWRASFPGTLTLTGWDAVALRLALACSVGGSAICGDAVIG